MNKYLNIKNFCEIVYGDNGAVVYNLDKLEKYNIFSVESNILSELQKGESIENLSKKYDYNTLHDLISNLEKNDIGYLAPNFIPTEPVRIGNLRLGMLQKIYSLNTSYIELPTNCNKKCSYCSTAKINGCYSCCLPQDMENKDISFYKNLIDTLEDYNCERIIIHGGNPLNDWNFTKSVLEYIKLKQKKFSVFIITNDSFVDNKILHYLSNKKINVIINTNYCNNLDRLSTIYKNYTNNNINSIVNFNVNYKLIKNFKKEYIQLYQKYKNIIYSLYSNEELLKINYHNDLPNNPIDVNLFNALDQSHPCLFGKISIKSNKKVYPCIGFTNNELIDLSQKTLEHLFFENKELINFWTLSLNNIKGCSNCKFKKCCSDCRSFELAAYNNVTSKLSCNVF